MATLSPSLHSIRFSSTTVPTATTSSPAFAFCSFPLQPRSSALKLVAFKAQTTSKNRRLSMAKAVEEDTQVPQPEETQVSTESQQEEQQSTSDQQPVVVPISPSDTLNMFFQAEGTLNETAIPALTKALEETEGVANLKVQVVEGLASVELKKQTTVQATGVASSLVETIQGSGFKLQTLNLSFDDEEDAAA